MTTPGFETHVFNSTYAGTPTAPDPLPASTSQFSLVGGATAPPPLEKQSSGSLVGDPDDGTIPA